MRELFYKCNSCGWKVTVRGAIPTRHHCLEETGHCLFVGLVLEFTGPLADKGGEQNG